YVGMLFLLLSSLFTNLGFSYACARARGDSLKVRQVCKNDKIIHKLTKSLK
ncbi:MAG: hypothetical protein ACI8RD_011868, partial [Bacillariaceae sp.]